MFGRATFEAQRKGRTLLTVTTELPQMEPDKTEFVRAMMERSLSNVKGIWSLIASDSPLAIPVHGRSRSASSNTSDPDRPERERSLRHKPSLALRAIR
jgi:hypothetical protein